MQEPIELEFTSQGYLQLPARVAREYFPNDVLVLLVRGDELWLMPTRGPASGGLLLKQRNPAGDRSVLAGPYLPPETPAGTWRAFWDSNAGAMRAAATSIAVRPQPAGIFPPPVSFLLLPETADRAPLSALMAGDHKVLLRGEWRFYRLALEGRIEEAWQAITGTGVIDDYNRFVLRPERAAYESLRPRLDGELAALLDAAAFACGLIERRPEAGPLTGELRACALLASASWHLEHDDPPVAKAALEEALEAARPTSPLLAAQILHQLGGLELAHDAASAISRYKDAIRLAGDTMLTSLRAELWLNLGIAWQQAAQGRRDPLLEAVKAYQEAIRCGLSVDQLPELYALAHNNLALAYLTIPAQDSSDQLRMGIAVQSLREALKVFRRETHPEMWSSAQLNLANALQYLPSSHPEENLQQAVSLYEELLGVRNRAADPLGYARLLANQANALAHLGIFGPALEKLSEAHKLFHWHGEPEMAASILDLVEQINARKG